MAVLATGGARYLGSVAVEYLISRGEQVIVLDNLVRGHRQALATEAKRMQDSSSCSRAI